MADNTAGCPVQSVEDPRSVWAAQTPAWPLAQPPCLCPRLRALGLLPENVVLAAAEVPGLNSFIIHTSLWTLELVEDVFCTLEQLIVLKCSLVKQRFLSFTVLPRNSRKLLAIASYQPSFFLHLGPVTSIHVYSAL